MSEEEEEEAKVTARPWHLWVVGIVMILWNSIGCLDFVMTQTKNDEYLEAFKFTPEQIEFLYSFPTWAVIMWGIAVWGSMLGVLLLLAKKRFAVEAYIVGLLTYCLAMIRQYSFTDFTELFPETSYPVMSVVVFILLLGQLLYARAMANRGVLS